MGRLKNLLEEGEGDGLISNSLVHKLKIEYILDYKINRRNRIGERLNPLMQDSPYRSHAKKGLKKA